MIFLEPDDYQPELERLYADIAATVGSALPHARIEHVGSSSIPGVISKGDLDIFVGVERDEFEASIEAIELLGFRIKQDTLRTDQLCMFEGDGYEVEVAIQLVELGSRFEFFLLFRDALTASASLREEYNALKRRAELLSPADYRTMKSAFIESVLRSAEQDRP